MKNTPLQTLLDERDEEFDDEFTMFGMGAAYHTNDTPGPAVMRAFLQESILKGVRLGLAMGRECVAPEDRGEYRAEENKEAQAVWNECRKMTLDRLEAKEKELGV